MVKHLEFHWNIKVSIKISSCFVCVLLCSYQLVSEQRYLAMVDNICWQEWGKEIANSVMESKNKQVDRPESRLQDMVTEMRSLIIGVNGQNMQAKGAGNVEEKVQGERNVWDNLWGSTTKFEFPYLTGWLLRIEYFIEVGKIAPKNEVKVAAMHLEGHGI